MHVEGEIKQGSLDHQYLSPINFDVPTVKSLYNETQYNKNLDKTNETVVPLQIFHDKTKKKIKCSFVPSI